MSNPTDLTVTALRELEVVATMVDDISTSGYDRPSNLQDWTMEQLVRHIVSVAFRQAEAYHRARVSVTQAPSDATVTASNEHLATALRAALTHATRATSELDRADDPVVPLPFASVPASMAGFVLLVEYGIHRYDVEHTMTGAGTLAGDVAGPIVDRLDLVLATLGTPDEPPVKTICLEADGRKATTVAWRSGRWGSAPDDQKPDCVVRGPADALVLFVAGRITAADDRLTIEDPEGALRHFKTMFPGP